MAETVIGDFGESEICEKLITKVNNRGEIKRRKKCAPGYKLVGNTCQRIQSGEKLSRAKGLRRSQVKRKAKKMSTKRKMLRARKIRKQRGL